MDVGINLRQAREARGLSVAALAAATRIPSRTIEGIERNELEALPPRPYGRGFVAAYAREVGLDADRAVRAYFMQFAATPSCAAAPETSGDEAERRRGWAPAAAVTVLVILAVAAIALWSTSEHADLRAVGTTGRVTAPAVTVGSSSDAGPEPMAGAGAMQAGAGQEIVVILDTDARAWVSASSDGRRVLYRLLPPRARETLRASRALTLRVGDAGAVRWSVNGAPAEPMGRRGEVRSVTIRRD